MFEEHSHLSPKNKTIKKEKAIHKTYFTGLVFLFGTGKSTLGV